MGFVVESSSSWSQGQVFLFFQGGVDMSKREHDQDEATVDTSGQVEESTSADSGNEKDTGKTVNLPESPNQEFVFPELYKD